MAAIFVESAVAEAKSGMIALTIKSGGETFNFVLPRATAHMLNAGINSELVESAPQVVPLHPKQLSKGGGREPRL